MQIFQDFLDQSRRLNQAPDLQHKKINLHAPNTPYPSVHYGLCLPNLPAPLHYLNFMSWLGQPQIPAFQNPAAIQQDELNTATVMTSVSGHMVGQLQSYSIKDDCSLSETVFTFRDKEQIGWDGAVFQIHREDTELSLDLSVQTTDISSCLIKLRLGLAEYWSVMCQCEGQIKFQGQMYDVNQLVVLSYAQIRKFPYLPLAFYTHQVINLSRKRQIIFMQTRDRYNNILSSRLYLRDLNQQQVFMADQAVFFKVMRVYPVVKTPNLQKMYLPREFEWIYQNDKLKIHVQAQSRGDFKFGLGAGYAGSFNYQIKINDEIECGEGGYCEYVDCRALKWQEKNEKDKLTDKYGNIVPFMLKK